MEYKIYTMPLCDKCKKIKEYFHSSNITFSEVDLGDDEGVIELRKVYPKLKDRVKRTDEGQLPIPLIVAMDGNEIKGIAHTLDETKAIVI